MKETQLRTNGGRQSSKLQPLFEHCGPTRKEDAKQEDFTGASDAWNTVG
jgi:hypothetical protein